MGPAVAYQNQQAGILIVECLGILLFEYNTVHAALQAFPSAFVSLFSSQPPLLSRCLLWFDLDSFEFEVVFNFVNNRIPWHSTMKIPC